MIHHLTLGRTVEARRQSLFSLIHQGSITLGGYKKAKIYGLLSCSSGKRMKIDNRVFFKDENEAIISGYRPCGHCMKDKYEQWKREQNKDKSLRST